MATSQITSAPRVLYVDSFVTPVQTELTSNPDGCTSAVQPPPLRNHKPYAHASFHRPGARAISPTAGKAVPAPVALAVAAKPLSTSRPTTEDGIVTPYNHGSLAVDPSAPFLVAPENASERTIASGDAAALAALTFEDAAARWLESKKLGLKGRTPVAYEHNVSQLNKFFGKLRVNKIHVGHLNEYQRARKANVMLLPDGSQVSPWKKTCGPSIINHELSVVQQVMKRAKEWSRIGDLYRALPTPASKKKKVLGDLEKRQLFAIAASRPEWEISVLVAKLTFNTTAAGTELRHLRFEDVILDCGQPRIIINADTAKNSYRGRVIALNAQAQAAIERCMERGRGLGAHLPEHYIFPFRKAPTKWDPTRPTTGSWLRHSFGSLRKAAGLPWLTPHCFRHMAITAMLENGAAPETVRHIAGHVSETMMRHYSHNRLAAQVGVLAALGDAPTPKKKSPAARAQQRQFMARGRRHLPSRRVSGQGR
jgi:integrase